MSQGARIGKSSPIISQVSVARIAVKSQGVKDWTNAINAARNELMPRRKALYELYDNLIFDGHLSAVMGKRTMNVTNKKVTYVEPDADESRIEYINDNILRTPWFYDFLSGSMEVVPFGPTVLELQPKAGLIDKCAVFPRANVAPEFGHISQDANNIMDPWLKYRDDPYYSTYLIEVGKPKDLGALVIALPYLMYKRGTFGDWAQFAELFGAPFRVGKYNPYDESTRAKLMTALGEMGGAGYTVIPDGTSLEFITASTGTGQGAIYKDLIELCNSEVSKIFLGQTMTTDQGSSKSQGEVHERVEDNITLADMKRTEFLLNWELHPRLMKLGYPISEKGRFEFDLTRNLSLEQRIDLDKKVAEQLGGQVPARYWYDTYGIPEPGKGDKVILPSGKAVDPGTEPEPTPEPAKPTKETKPKAEKNDPAKPVKEAPEKAEKKKHQPKETASLTHELAQLYATTHTCGHTKAGRFSAADEPEFEGSEKIMNALAKGIHDGSIKEGYIDPALMQWTADELTKGLLAGGLVDDSDTEQGIAFRNFIDENVQVFSGFKSYQTLKAATDELLDEAGQVRSFAQFKKRIMAIDETYNRDYLRSEYELAVSSGQMAERWQQIQANKATFPYLKYITAGDDRVRETHASLDGVERPVDDAFWSTHYPPNGWRCRCDVDAIQGPSGNGRVINTTDLAPQSPMFNNNVGATGVVFPKHHPYFQAPPSVANAVKAAVKPRKVAAKRKPKNGDAVGTPVSKALNTTATELQGTFDTALAAIDKVHGDGVLEPLELQKLVTGRNFGEYHSRLSTARVIRVRASGNHKALTLTHEIGHWLDHQALGENSNLKWGTSTDAMKSVMATISKSPSTAHLVRTFKTRTCTTASGNAVKFRANSKFGKYVKYLIDPIEQWARAYSQYITLRSNDATLLADLERVRGQVTSVPQLWTDAEFVPIAKEIDALFIAKGWRK